MVDLIFHGRILDGTGAPAFAGTVFVTKGVITEVTRDDAPCAVPRMPAVGAQELGELVLAPGFIDIHSHADHFLLIDPAAASKVRQGVTTDVIGNCGYSAAPLTPALRARRAPGLARYGLTPHWTSFAEYLDALGAARPAINVAALVGHATLRAVCAIPETRAANAQERAHLAAATSRALDDGACGATTGVFYAPGRAADRAELEALLAPVRERGALYAAHIRDEASGVLGALTEALDVTRTSGVRFQYSHIKAWGRNNWRHRAALVKLMETARATGLDVATDIYPYTSAATDLASGLGLNRVSNPTRRGDVTSIEWRLKNRAEEDPRWASRVRILSCGASDYSGRRLDDLPDPIAAVQAILTADPRTAAAFHELSETNVRGFMSLPYAAIGSDAANRNVSGPLSVEPAHPRAFGTFPRILGRYVRELGLLTLEDAVYRMTGLPAARLALPDRGRIAPGCRADLVAFDPETIKDTATFAHPHVFPKGIVHVWVNGVAVVEHGRQTDARPGLVLRGR